MSRGAECTLLFNCRSLLCCCVVLMLCRNSNAQGGAWTSWSPCSVSCGTGTKLRVRHCVRNCVGRDHQIKSCKRDCSPDLEQRWGPWSRWSNCREGFTLTCGGGLMTRVRSCIKKHSNSSSNCKGTSKQTKFCQLRLCVVGGVASEPAKWPWQVFIEITRENNEKIKSQCGGTLIAEQWILSAGHCFLDPYKNTWKPTRITLGTTYRNGVGQGAVNFSTAEVYIHKDFDPVALSNDISLLKLSKVVDENKYIRKAVLPPSGTVVQKGKSCIVTGWGATKPDGSITSIADELQETDVKIFSDDDCSTLSSFSHFSLAVKSQVCAGHIKGGKDTCSGDSGGPLMCREKTGYVVRGITSHGPLKCGTPNQPGVYTRVSTFLKWIDRTIQGYHWKLGIKSKCSVTCGKGNERRSQTCRNRNGKLVSSSNCDGASTLVFECNKPKCETFKWSPWKSTCSVTCGHGKLTRTRECLSEKNNHKVENFNCGFGKIHEISTCNRPNCPASWGRWSSWSPCTKFCSPEGRNTRVRSCLKKNNIPSSSCTGKSKETRRCLAKCAVGGFASDPGKWPWQVFIEITQENNENIKSQCGGTLISEQWILSAGHCFLDEYKNAWKPTRITLGTTYRDGTGQGAVNFLTADVYIHENFDHVALSSDISLIKLPKAVSETRYIQKAVLPQPGTVVQKGKSCIATGWGATKPDGTSIADDLQEVDVKIFGDDECTKLNAFSQFTLVAKSQVCAGHVKGGKDTCSGDSGGPLMCREGKGYVVRGITSHGPKECGAANQPGVYTRVSTFLRWIDRTVQGHQWKLGIKSKCSVTCGRGIESQPRTCRDQNDKLVSNSNCDGASTLLFECIKPECEAYKWSQWKSTCSVTCGGGKLTRTRECLKNNHRVENSNCGFGKTHEISTCSRSICPEYHWKLGEKSECSVTCGKGIERQPRTCRDQHGKLVSNSNCVGASTLTFECVKPECDTYKWSPWKSTCSVTCGGGKLTRTRECLSEKNSRKVESFNCGFEKTHKSSKCNRPICPEYTWKLIKTVCSVTCGKGIERKTRMCIDAFGKSVPAANCKGLSVLLGECYEEECETFHWSKWTTRCSTTCGKGTQIKSRRCLDKKGNTQSTSRCKGGNGSHAVGNCNEGSCKTQQESNWGPWQTYCTVTCGSGIRIKVRECYDEQTKAKSNSCKTGSKHQVDGFCNNTPCTITDSPFRWGQWSSWSSCRVALTSGVCNGFRSATRNCLHGAEEVDPQKCKTPTRPTEDYYREEACVPRNCGSG